MQDENSGMGASGSIGPSDRVIHVNWVRHDESLCDESILTFPPLYSSGSSYKLPSTKHSLLALGANQQFIPSPRQV